MLKTFLTATAIGGLMLSSALAQSPAPPPPAATPAPPPTTMTAPKSDMAPAPRADAAGKASFVSAQKSDQWLSSKFKGTDVLGPNNEKIGDVKDLLFDKSGKIDALIVGVGGFLGIGEKDVALDMAAFTVVPASTTSGNTGATMATTATDDPNNIKLKVAMTKDELKNAPAFEAYKAPSRTTSSNTPANTGTTRPAPAPRP